MNNWTCPDCGNVVYPPNSAHKCLTNNLTYSKLNSKYEEVPEIKRVKRKIVDWLFKFAHDEEVYEIISSYNIKI